jgi:hypothetical protein
VHAGTKALLVGDALQQARQLLAFWVRQGCAERLLVFSRDLGDAPQHVFSLARHIERVTPAIARLITSLNQAARFEIVNQRHKPAGRHAEFASERLLADPFRRLNDSKDSGISRNQI